MKVKMLLLAGVVAMLPACQRENRNPSESETNATASAEGKAEDGRVTVKAPGVDISVRIPEAVRSRMATEGNNEILPPGVQVGGVHVQGNGSEGGTGGTGQVELTFRSEQSPEQVAAWYRDPTRREHFTLGSETREGAALVLAGATRENGGNFSVRLAPRQGGGTDGRLMLSDRS